MTDNDYYRKWERQWGMTDNGNNIQWGMIDNCQWQKMGNVRQCGITSNGQWQVMGMAYNG